MAPVVPTVDTTALQGAGKAGTHGLAFVNVNPLGANDTAATDRDSTGWAAKWQWADSIPPLGTGHYFEFGGVLYYPWGNTRVPAGTPRVPYGALMVYKKPRAAVSAADVAADFTDVGDGTAPPCVGGVAHAGNWTYINLRTLCASSMPADIASKLVGRGGGRLDNYAQPHYAYCPGQNDVPGTYSIPPGVGGITAGYMQAQNSLQQDNPVMLRIDVTADPTTAGAYTALNLPLALYNQYGGTALPANVYGTPARGGRGVGGWVDLLGGQFSGWSVGGRMYFAPVLYQAGQYAHQPNMTIVSVDEGNPAYFTDPTHWYWMDFRNPPAGMAPYGGTSGNMARHFGGFQGSVANGSCLYFVQSVPSSWFWCLDTSVGDGGYKDNTGKLNVAANPAAWKSMDPVAVHGHAGITGYLNGGTVTDPITGHHCIIYCPFAPDGSPHDNPYALIYDTTLPFDQVASWRTLDISQIDAKDSNMDAHYPPPHIMGYQGAAQDRAGNIWLMPTWNTPGNHQSPWLCCPKGSPIEQPGSWHALPSYTQFGNAQMTVGIWGCGLAKDKATSTIFPALFGGGPPGPNTGHGAFPNGTGTGGVLAAMTPTLP